MHIALKDRLLNNEEITLAILIQMDKILILHTRKIVLIQIWNLSSVDQVY